jgi:para-aminobenzoate synthetase component 1
VNHSADWLFGFFSYDLKNEIEPLKSENLLIHEIPNIYFFQPKVVITVKENSVDIKYISGINPDEELKKILNFKYIFKNHSLKDNLELRFNKSDYVKSVNNIKEHIRIGDVYELNFCMDYHSNDIIIDPIKSYISLNSLTESPMSAFFKLKSLHLLSSSPERFIKKKNNRIITQPIKGTIRRDKDITNDLKNINYLNNNSKELSENHMIVDLVRNDLSRVAKKGTVKVKELSVLYSFKNVHQLISTVEAEIRNSTRISKILKSTFPMGSMTGAPKIRSMELIEKFEKTQRGIYSGAVGYISPKKDFDFNVVIRSIIYDSGRNNLSINVGSAITFASDPEQEFNECKLKAEAMISSLK